MGFARITCGVCEGKGQYKVTAGSLVPNTPMTCGNCNGEGTIVIHTNQVGPTGSYNISVDPAGTGTDKAWATLWEKLDDGTIKVIDCGEVKP